MKDNEKNREPLTSRGPFMLKFVSIFFIGPCVIHKSMKSHIWFLLFSRKYVENGKLCFQLPNIDL